MKRGKLIVIEGTDCSGKETQTKLLVNRMIKEGIDCSSMSFPRYETSTGRIIGECYLGRTDSSWFEDANSVDPYVASMYYAADRFVAKQEILDIINSGKNLILNRYVESNMGHQGGKARNLQEKEKVIDFLDKLEYGLLELPRPDLVIFLHVPHLVVIKLKENRIGKADSHEANPNHLRNAEETYLGLADKFNWTKIDCTFDNSIRSLKTPEQVHEEIWKIVSQILIKDE